MNDQLSLALGYPHTPGFKEPTTSQDAAIRIFENGSAKYWEAKCMEALREKGPMTAKETWEHLDKDKDNIRPALSRLKGQGVLDFQKDALGNNIKRDRMSVYFIKTMQ